MSIDLSQFHQVFHEESFEGLDVMESALMDLNPKNINTETINAIFRAAHSIKGGSATFGFSKIAEFTHVLETFLDQVRSGARAIKTEEVELLLQSVDAMREMLNLSQRGENQSTPKSEQLKSNFDRLLHVEQKSSPNKKNKPSNKSAKKVEEAAISTGVTRWHITFKPGLQLLQTGNDPVRILQVLREFGDVEIEANLDEVPGLTELDPENLYISWVATVPSYVTKEKINEAFEWVADTAEVSIVLREAEASVSPITEIYDQQWHIHFVPNEGVLRTGNDICKMLSDLQARAKTYSAHAQTNRLPSLKLLDPEAIYLSWDFIVSGDIQRNEIEDVFSWIADESLLHVELINPAAANKDKGIVSDVEVNATELISDDAHKSINIADSGSAIPAKKNSATENSSIRVGIDKIDNLINMVGELVITQSMLGQLGTDFDAEKIPKLLEGLNQLEQNTRELQESVMRIRMLPISFAFSRFPRMVRDVGQQLDKKIHLEMNGEQTELDKTVMEKIGDPLVHLVRNAIDHGIEMPEERLASGKSETGNIVLNAYHQGGNVVIEISDDGRGLDRDKLIAKAQERNILVDVDPKSLTDDQVYDFIFQPGFSTAESVSDLSGRGVGMDVVRRNIQSLNGIVEIQSKKGLGSTIRIRLPLTLAILDGQLIRVGNSTYIFPLVSIVESIQCHKNSLNHVAGGCSVFKLREDYVPVINLYEVFSIQPDATESERVLMVVAEADGEKVGIVVDELLAQQQVVIKSLEQNYQKIEGVSGATILGDGTVALIIDIPGVVRIMGANTRKSNSHSAFIPQRAKTLTSEPMHTMSSIGITK